ncbi:hypothetical protein [Cellulomonas sp. GbtcB1]|uniref:hypothetical protein n=1 Tax=Cellulomonas sp. GbtcB1 TaxID=2824746 RepID=UPI001C30FAE6|nr:hypothetical protein [Cellulomonas sp. GbtcB1]
MTRRRLPRIAALSGPEAALARHVDVHSPVPAGTDALTWTLTLLDDGGVPLAESRTTSPDFPLPLADIAQVHLDVVGLARAGEWEPVATRGGGARFRAPVRPGRPPA